MDQALPGASAHSKKGRSKNTVKNAANSSKLKRKTETLKIEALERDAMTFVSIILSD